MVMRNSINKTEDYNGIPYTFDLKGSKVKRRSMPRDIRHYSSKKIRLMAQQVLKDIDLTNLTRYHDKNLINISLADRRKIMSSV
jgi:hypothetical protein